MPKRDPNGVRELEIYSESFELSTYRAAYGTLPCTLFN